MKLTEKIAVITGGTKGIGYAIAETLLKAGANVFICARDKSELKRALEKLSEFGQSRRRNLRCSKRSAG